MRQEEEEGGAVFYALVAWTQLDLGSCVGSCRDISMQPPLPIHNEEVRLCPAGQGSGSQGQVKVQPVWRGEIEIQSTPWVGAQGARWTGIEGTPKPDPLLPATALRTTLGFSGCPRMPYKFGQPELGAPMRGVPSSSNLALVIWGLPDPTWAFEPPKNLASHLSSGRPGGL